MRAQRYLLTYSQVPDTFDRDGLGPFLRSIFEKATCITVAVEEHPTTGGYHLHSYVDASTPFVINEPSLLDWSDCHPNIKPVRTTPHKAYQYTLKDGEVIFEEGEIPETPSKLSNDDKWTTILEATTKEDFLKAAVDTAPRDSVLHFSSLLTFADWRYRDTPGEFIAPEYECRCESYPTLTDWIKSCLLPKTNGRRKSLIMYGPSLTGKTTWARSQGPHAYFPGLFMLEGFSPSDVEYAIFDDMMHGIYSIPNWKFWLGGQSEFAIGDKYMRKQRITWGKPCIFIGNSDPRLTLSGTDLSWLEANCLSTKDPLVQGPLLGSV
ncbi:hypothetical protein V8E54_001549 [Elaphomyces granulatus]